MGSSGRGVRAAFPGFLNWPWYRGIPGNIMLMKHQSNVSLIEIIPANRYRSVLLGLLTAAILSGSGNTCCAQGAPDIVWKTNANAGRINSVAFSPDVAQIATAWSDASVKIWRVADRGLLLRFTNYASEVTLVFFSPDGTHVASCSPFSFNQSDSDSIKYWRISDGGVEWTAPGGGPENVLGLSPDGKILAV